MPLLSSPCGEIVFCGKSTPLGGNSRKCFKKRIVKGAFLGLEMQRPAGAQKQMPTFGSVCFRFGELKQHFGCMERCSQHGASALRLENSCTRPGRFAMLAKTEASYKIKRGPLASPSYALARG